MTFVSVKQVLATSFCMNKVCWSISIKGQKHRLDFQLNTNGHILLYLSASTSVG